MGPYRSAPRAKAPARRNEALAVLIVAAWFLIGGSEASLRGLCVSVFLAALLGLAFLGARCRSGREPGDDVPR